MNKTISHQDEIPNENAEYINYYLFLIVITQFSTLIECLCKTVTLTVLVKMQNTQCLEFRV